MQDFAAYSIGHIAPQTILYEGRYRIDLLLAAAPTRAVYRAWDLVQQRPATILELATPDLTIAAAALQHSAPLVQLDHAALTPIQVIFVEKTTLFFALALAGGQTIERIMAERANPITPAAAVRWIAQAAEGVEFLDRELPTWHIGDLSPAALLVTAEDRVQLLGFEVALGLLTPQALAASLPAGAVAPELALGLCDARSDVYGLAATLYYLLTRQRWTAQRESLANARPDLSRALVATVMRGLAEQPESRWPDAATFYQELLRSLPINHPAQHGAPWWDEAQPQFDGLAEEPPTLVTTRDQLRAAVAAQQAALGITAAEAVLAPDAAASVPTEAASVPDAAASVPDEAVTDPTTAVPAPEGTSAPPDSFDTYIVMSPDAAHTDAPAPTTDEIVTETAIPATETTARDDVAEHNEELPQLAPISSATDEITAQEDDVSPPALADPIEQTAVIPTYPLEEAPTEQHADRAAPAQAAQEPAADIEEPQAAAPSLPDAPPAAEANAAPEPVPVTLIRPRWPWSDAPADEGSTDVTPPATSSADATEPPITAAPALDTSALESTAAAPESSEEPVTAAPSDEDGVTPTATSAAPFADTVLRWSPLLVPAVEDAASVAASHEPPPASAPESPASLATTAENSPQEESIDLTALPTQIKAPASAEETPSPASDVPTPPPPSPWDAPAPVALNDPVTGTSAVDDREAPQLTLDADIVAASSPALSDAPPPASASESATATHAPEQVIVAHSDYMSSEPPPVDPPKTSKTPSRPLGSSLLDKLRGILHSPGQMPALATGTVVVPRHMYPQHTYSVLVRLQCRPAAVTPPGESARKEATFIIVEVEASGDAFYVPVRRLALRLPNEGGLSEGTFTITALRPSVPNETDPITFTFRSVDNQLLHEGQFLAEISILAPQQLAGGNPMLTLVHALDIEQALA